MPSAHPITSRVVCLLTCKRTGVPLIPNTQLYERGWVTFGAFAQVIQGHPLPLTGRPSHVTSVDNL